MNIHNTPAVEIWHKHEKKTYCYVFLNTLACHIS